MGTQNIYNFSGHRITVGSKLTAIWTASRNWLFEFIPLLGWRIFPRGTLIPFLNAMRVSTQVSVFLFSTMIETSDSLKSTFMKTHTSRSFVLLMITFVYFFLKADSGLKLEKSLIVSFSLQKASCLSSAFVVRGGGFGVGRHDFRTSNSVGGSTGRV